MEQNQENNLPYDIIKSSVTLLSEINHIDKIELIIQSIKRDNIELTRLILNSKTFSDDICKYMELVIINNSVNYLNLFLDDENFKKNCNMFAIIASKNDNCLAIKILLDNPRTDLEKQTVNLDFIFEKNKLNSLKFFETILNHEKFKLNSNMINGLINKLYEKNIEIIRLVVNHKTYVNAVTSFNKEFHYSFMPHNMNNMLLYITKFRCIIEFLEYHGDDLYHVNWQIENRFKNKSISYIPTCTIL